MLPAVVLDDLAAHRQADAGPGVGVPRRAAAGRSRRSARRTPARCRCRCRRPRTRQQSPSRSRRHAHARRLVAAELDRVADQVLEHERRAASRSPQTTGRRPSTSTVAPVSSMAERERLAALRRRARRRRRARAGASTRPTREKASRSLISSCMRLAPSTAKAMYCSPRSSSWPA